MGLRTNRETKGIGRLIAPFLLATTICLGVALCVPMRVAHADEIVADDADGSADNETTGAVDTAGLEDNLRAKTIEERIKMYMAQQSDDREVDFLSIVCDSGDLDIDMTITYANDEPSKAYRPDYLYVRLDADGDEGFKWLSPVVDIENGNTLSYSFHLSAGRRAAFWIFDYPKERVNETPPTLSIKVADRQGREVYGSAVGSFKSTFEAPGDGTFYLSNARVDENAEDKAGLPNAKIVFSVPEDVVPEQNPDNSDDASGDDTPQDTNDDGNGGGGKIKWNDEKVPQLGDAVVLISVISIVLSIAAIIAVNSKRK